jgi:hypothetical protein
MRDSTAFRCRRRPWALAAAALLVGALSGSPTAAAGWSLRAEPATGGKVPGCSMVSEQQPIPDGYQQTWAQILVDREAIRVTSPSQLDPADGDIGLSVDEGAFVRIDEVIDKRTAVFRTQYQPLVEDFKRGLKVRVQLRFWPTWPKTGTHSATFSLIGFTRTHAGLAECRTP